MSATTTIAWTDATWNPVRGCTRVSEGCRHCYAERVAARFSGPGQAYHGLAIRTPDGPRWTGAVRLVPATLRAPLAWRRPRRIFVNSMSDLFHEGLPDADVAAVFHVMARAPRHTFQVLTKRPARARALWPRLVATFGALPHVWLGVSVEDQATADARIPVLLTTPAAVRFVSAEPLLAPIHFEDAAGEARIHWLHGEDRCDPPVPGLDWVIVGGESGPGARPCAAAWIQSVVDQCRCAGVPCFVKQLGAVVVAPNDEIEAWENDVRSGPWAWAAPLDAPVVEYGPGLDYQGAPCRVRLRDPKGADPTEWPDALRVQEFPA